MASLLFARLGGGGDALSPAGQYKSIPYSYHLQNRSGECVHHVKKIA